MTSIVLAACLNMPSFSTDGPLCTPERQQLSCECSETISWDGVSNTEWYEIERMTVSSGTWSRQGMSWMWQECDDSEPPVCRTVGPPTMWFPPKDYSMPRDGVLYRYRVRACNGYGCGEWSILVDYRAAPYACYRDGHEVQCYVGDDIISR